MQKSNTGRDVRLDNVKGVLILLVVFGHVLELFLAKSALYRAIYSGIYIFHIPLFVMIAGMLSKATLQATDFEKIITRLLLPLIIFQILYVGFIGLKSSHPAVPLLQPYWILWFLLSMIFWRLALPLFVRVPFFLAISFAIALAAGFSKSIAYTLSLSRTLYFFPFFLIGYSHGKRIIAFAVAHRHLLALIFLLIFAGIGWWSLIGLPHNALYGSLGYAAVPVIKTAPAVGRALVLVLSFACAAGALALFYFPRELFINLGRRSLTVFVLHGFAVMGLSALVNRLHIEPSALLLPALLGISLSIAVAASLFDPWLNRLYEAIGSRFRLHGNIA